MANRYGWMADTSPEAFEKMLEITGAMTPGERVQQSLRLSAWMIRMSEADVRRRHPEASAREVFLRAASRRLGRDLMVRAYGWDPAEHDD